MEKAMRLNPRPPADYLEVLGHAYYLNPRVTDKGGIPSG